VSTHSEEVHLSEGKIDALWNEYVPKHLLPRLHGYELLMAPYAIAHLKVGLKLYETGYRFSSEERARIYLTNALEPQHDLSGRFEFAIPALAHEAQAVNEIKRRQRFTVVIGNPPYSALSANLTTQARNLVSRFKFIDGARLDERGALQLEKNLQDDYIKFIAFVEDTLTATSSGVCGLICNHGFIDNPTLRGVRWSLMQNFLNIWILDLHGNVNRGEVAPDGSDDQNVFDIKDAGVAIFLGAKHKQVESSGVSIRKSDLWGDRNAVKYPYLLSKSVTECTWEFVSSEPDLFLFRAISQGGSREYSSWPKVTAVFPLHSVGMITARDSYVIDFESGPIIERAQAFRDSRLDDEATCEKLGIPIKKGWNIRRSRERIKQVKDIASFIKPLLYRPFDVRRVFYHESLIWGMAWPVMQHMIDGKNLALITSRMTKGEAFCHTLVSNTLSEVILLSSKTSNNAFVFPLHLRSNERGLRLEEQVNLGSEFLQGLQRRLGLRRSNSHGMPEGVSPEDVFHYIYAVLSGPGFRARYAEFLKIDFPRIPLPGSPDLFFSLSRLGRDLVDIHLLKSPNLTKPITEFIGGRQPEVEKISWSRDTVWVDKAQIVGFKGVREDVWSFRVGGYQVCEKWLKDRKGRTLSRKEIEHYQKIIVALAETIRIMKRIDEVIEADGGWPGAFAEGNAHGRSITMDGDAGSVTTLQHSNPAAPIYQTVSSQLLKAAEPDTTSHESAASGGLDVRGSESDELVREDLICRIRNLFGDGQERERDAAIDALARELGYERTGARIYDELDGAMRAAVRRGITASDRGVVRLFARAIEEYDRDFLKEQFLASLQGRQWTPREEAVRSFARWMGFRRTGPAIEDAARSLINGLLREGRLESAGSEIRRSD
jgi:predicted helicase